MDGFIKSEKYEENKMKELIPNSKTHVQLVEQLMIKVKAVLEEYQEMEVLEILMKIISKFAVLPVFKSVFSSPSYFCDVCDILIGWRLQLANSTAAAITASIAAASNSSNTQTSLASPPTSSASSSSTTSPPPSSTSTIPSNSSSGNVSLNVIVAIMGK